MATFDGTTFQERGRASGTFLPIHGAKCRYAVLHVPQSSISYIQIAGVDGAPLDLPARVTAAQLASLRGKVGTQGTLVYAGGTLTAIGTSCTLVEVSDVQEIKKDADMYFCTLKFLTK